MWRNITIRRDSPSFIKDGIADSFGSFDNKTGVITIQPEITKETLANTLLHELLHVAIEDCSLNSDTKDQRAALSEDLEEIVVNSVANHLVSVFKDNTWLLPFLHQEINWDKS